MQVSGIYKRHVSDASAERDRAKLQRQVESEPHHGDSAICIKTIAAVRASARIMPAMAYLTFSPTPLAQKLTEAPSRLGRPVIDCRGIDDRLIAGLERLREDILEGEAAIDRLLESARSVNTGVKVHQYAGAKMHQ